MLGGRTGDVPALFVEAVLKTGQGEVMATKRAGAQTTACESKKEKLWGVDVALTTQTFNWCEGGGLIE